MYRFLPFPVVFMWLLAMNASYQAGMTAARGDYFAIDVNRLGEVVGWQVMATAMAVFLWRLGRTWPKGPMRFLSVLPLLVALGIGLWALILMAFSLFGL